MNNESGNKVLDFVQNNNGTAKVLALHPVNRCELRIVLEGSLDKTRFAYNVYVSRDFDLVVGDEVLLAEKKTDAGSSYLSITGRKGTESNATR